MNSFRPEINLLLDSARTCLDAQGASRIKSLISKDIDWGYLIRVARGHGVMPLLYRTLNSRCSDAVPKEILQELREHFYANAGRNLFLTKELIKIVEFFEAHGIPSIPYKGPVLATSVYGNLAFREFGDLDILVKERNYPTAQQLLMHRGYSLAKQFEYESTFMDSTGRIAVDLHKGMTAREFSCPLNFTYLSGRLQRMVLAGTEVPTLSPEDTLLMLAIQITKDSGSHYFQLAKICDVAELLRAHPQLDLAHVLRQAKRLGGERMLLYSLRLANNLLDAVLPSEVVRQMSFHPAIDGLVEYAQRQLFDDGDRAVPDQPTVDQFRWLIRERLRDKLYPYYQRYVTDVIAACGIRATAVASAEGIILSLLFHSAGSVVRQTRVASDRTNRDTSNESRLRKR
ncbi:MAG TPA: nucleotidyltransferase family protein [Pyrinomonadaceae bacterium]|nr:nucleotidyltransferase family protein [Pyrinomonadaceae bacterium]